MNYAFDVLNGKHALLRAILESINDVKSSIIICIPELIPEIFDEIKQVAAQKKTTRFLIVCKFQKKDLESVKKEFKSIKNVQLRKFNTDQSIEFCSVTRDTEEIILGPIALNDDAINGFRTNHPSYSKLYAQIIGPVFLANSRPIK